MRGSCSLTDPGLQNQLPTQDTGEDEEPTVRSWTVWKRNSQNPGKTDHDSLFKCVFLISLTCAYLFSFRKKCNVVPNYRLYKQEIGMKNLIKYSCDHKTQQNSDALGKKEEYKTLLRSTTVTMHIVLCCSHKVWICFNTV